MSAWQFAGAGLSAAAGVAGSLVNANQRGIDRDDNRFYTENAHQVEVKDLRKAGLNPILSATGGSGANWSASSSGDIAGPASAGMASSAAMIGQIPKMLADIAVAEQTVKNMDTERVGQQWDNITKEANSTLTAALIDKLNIDKKYWDGTAKAEFEQKLATLKSTQAGIDATTASAAE